jgi:cysteine-rich repeat protein
MPPTPLRAAAPALLLLVARLAGATTAANVCTGDPCELRTAIRVTANSVLNFGTRTFRIMESGRLDVDAGDTLTIIAGALLMERGALIRMTPGGTVGPRVLVDTTGAITLRRTGLSRARIDVNGPDGAGEISLVADGNVTIDGDLAAQATTVGGDGGEVTITAGGDATVNGSITVDGGGDGVAGDLAITAARAIVTGAGGFAAVPSFSARSGIVGGTITLTAGGSSSVRTRLDADGFGADGDGGEITLEATGNLTLGEQMSSDGGGVGSSGSGGSIELRGGGTARLDARVSAGGSSPNGTGGTIDAFAGLDLLITQPLVAVGGDGTGGSITLDAGRLVRMGALVDAHGGGAGFGGDVVVGSSESIEAASEVNASGGTAGNIDLSTRTSGPPGLVAGGPVTVTGSLAARGNAPGIARSLRLEGCDVSVAASGALTTGGTPPLGILLQGSGQITVAGPLEALPGGTIRFQHRDPAKPPVVTRAPSPPAATSLVTALIPCRGIVVPPVCGNGTRETGEACDDDNTTACDGCSATCTVEACGNGTRECSEGCDDNNLVSGDGCDANCRPTGCGNTVLTAGEECDDGNLADGDGCSAACRIEAPPGCGDGGPDPGEQCDDGNAVACDGCSPTCVLEGCGNNLVECTEPCDDGNATSCDGCAAGCRLEVCGDAVPECGEACDLGTANGTPGSGCTVTCEGCALGEDPSCPCLADTDCHPLGRCAGAVCEAGLCVSVPAPACDDGNPCNGVETCTDGVCGEGTPLSCDDGDLCTSDLCDATTGACSHVPRTGADGVRCRLERIDALVAGGGVRAPFDERIVRLTDAIRTKLAEAEATTGRAARKRYAAVAKKLAALRRLVNGGKRRKRIDTDVAAALAGAASEARDTVRAVRASLPR